MDSPLSLIVQETSQRAQVYSKFFSTNTPKGLPELPTPDEMLEAIYWRLNFEFEVLENKGDLDAFLGFVRYCRHIGEAFDAALASNLARHEDPQ